MDNTTLIIDSKRNFHLENQPTPVPGPDEALIAIDSVGICGTDIHFYHEGHIGDIKLDKPHILGHESGGTIVKVGKNVTNVKPGDRVCLEPAVPCWVCKPCKSGRYNHCLTVKCQSIPPDHGHLRKYFVHPADLCFKLPDNLTLQEGAIIEPLACAVWACKRADVSMGKKIFICGSGSIGLLCMLVAKAIGASTICMADVRPSRLESAKKLGADQVLLVDTKDPQVLADKVIKLIGEPPDITLDCSGTECAVQTGILATAYGGVVEIVGLPPPTATLPILTIVLKELDLRSSLRFVHCFPTAIDLVSSGKINVKPLITHRFKLSEAAKAFETAHTGAENCIKVMIAPAE